MHSENVVPCIEVYYSPCMNVNAIPYGGSLCSIRFFVAPCIVVYCFVLWCIAAYCGVLPCISRGFEGRNRTIRFPYLVNISFSMRMRFEGVDYGN